MSNMKKTDNFLKAIEKAGLNETFGKMCTIASKTIGVHLDDLIDDFVYQMENPTPEVNPVYSIVYQDRWMQREGKWWLLINDRAKQEGRTGWVAEHTFLSIESAKAALERKMRSCNGKARVDTSKCGEFGIDLVVDEATAADEVIVNWKLRRQFKSVWEEVESH